MAQTPKTLEDHQSALALTQGQPARNRQTFAVRLSAAQGRIAQSPLPDIESYIEAHVEIPILEKIIADHDFNSPDDHCQRAGDAYAAANVEELVSLLRADLSDQTKNKKSVIEKIGARVAEFGSKIITAISPEAAMQARDARAAAEAEAESIEIDIAASASAIRHLELMPSVASFNNAVGVTSRVKLSGGVVLAVG